MHTLVKKTIASCIVSQIWKIQSEDHLRYIAGQHSVFMILRCKELCHPDTVPNFLKPSRWHCSALMLPSTAGTAQLSHTHNKSTVQKNGRKERDFKFQSEIFNCDFRVWWWLITSNLAAVALMRGCVEGEAAGMWEISQRHLMKSVLNRGNKTRSETQ